MIDLRGFVNDHTCLSDGRVALYAAAINMGKPLPFTHMFMGDSAEFALRSLEDSENDRLLDYVDQAAAACMDKGKAKFRLDLINWTRRGDGKEFAVLCLVFDKGARVKQAFLYHHVQPGDTRAYRGTCVTDLVNKVDAGNYEILFKD